VNRKNSLGFCGVDDNVRIAKYYLHKFEEPCVSGTNGSGTVFFCGCSLKCVFCQNYSLSRAERGKIISVKELADIFKQLEDSGAHNINLVTPTQYADKIMQALDLYRPNIPIVYNTHGYEKISVLEKLNKYVDVYLPDIKFFSPEVSNRYTGKKDYFEVASRAVKFMVESKPLLFDKDGLIKSGVIVRHLVLPQNVNDTKRVLDWFTEFSDKAYINVMSQYTPFGNIDSYPELKRKLTKREYESVLDYVISLGLKNVFYQDQKSSSTEYIPNWDF
jgi:putative pyruvate formate lyase activating enzyme